MQTPDWLKPAMLGAGAGAVALALLGFTWGGWVTESKANVMASEQSQDDVLAVLVPICVSNAGADPMAPAKISELKDASTYQRTAILAGTGWATMPGSDSPNDKLARACAVVLVE